MQTINIGGVLYLWPGGAILYKAGEPKPCGRGWTGTKPPGCKRAQRKAKATKKSSKAEAPTKTEKPARSKAKQPPESKPAKPLQQQQPVSAYKIPATGRSVVDAEDPWNPFNPDSMRDMGGYRVVWATNPAIGQLPASELSGAIGAQIESEGLPPGDEPVLVIGTDRFNKDLAEKFDELGAGLLGGDYSVLLWDDDELKPLTDKDKQAIAETEERWNLHNAAFGDVAEIAREIMIATIMYPGKKKKMMDQIKEPLKRHKAATKKLWATEDKQLGRTPSKQNRTALEKTLKDEAQKWAKSMGFSGEGVNGFSADATKAHDIAHPAAHRLLGLNSQQINQTFGGLKDPDGKPSLIAEEALVNAVEHLSRGDTLEASIQNGLRLAKVQSRDGTDEERAYVRSEEFARGVIDLIENRVYKNNEYSNLMPIVRDYNVISGTVTTSGADFTNSAAGG